MNDELIDRYDALCNLVEYPQDYAERWTMLANAFSIDARYSMAEKCRERAAHYSRVKINGTPAPVVGRMTLQTPRHKVVYLAVEAAN